MRKILLTTTALVAFGLTNEAVAKTMSHVDKGITISGSDEFACYSWSDDVDDTAGQIIRRMRVKIHLVLHTTVLRIVGGQLVLKVL